MPPLQAGSDPLSDPRIKASGVINMLRHLAPGLSDKLDEAYWLDPIEFEESFIFMLSRNDLNVIKFPTAGFSFIEELLQSKGSRVVLRYERLFFTILDAYLPALSHWKLKSPSYSTALPMILEEYPDARVVVTHRNPLVVLPSCARLMESWCIPLDRDGCFDKHRFGEYNAAFYGNSETIPLRYRQANPEQEKHIIDCLYEELFADPVVMVKRID